jgi:hypothetical protein
MDVGPTAISVQNLVQVIDHLSLFVINVSTQSSVHKYWHVFIERTMFALSELHLKLQYQLEKLACMHGFIVCSKDL